jgi:ribosomal protein L37E
MGGASSDSGVVLRNEPEFLSQFICEACGFSFVQFSALEQHVMSTHIPRHRESVPWSSRNNIGMFYGVTNSPQNNTVNSKSPQDIPVVSNHSVAKQFTVLKSNDSRDQLDIELETNILESNIAEHSIMRHSIRMAENVTESDEDAGMATERGERRKVESLSGQNGKLLKCKVCGSNSYDVNELMKHWRIHIGTNSMTCTICKKTFSDLPFLQAHWKRSHLQGNPVLSSADENHLLQAESLVCEACGYAFPDLSRLEQHLLSTHVTASSSHAPLKNMNYADNTQTASYAHKQNATIEETKSVDRISCRIQVMNHSKQKDKGKPPDTKVCRESQDTAETEEDSKKLNNLIDLGSKRNKSHDWCLVCGETSDDMIKHLVTHTGVLSLECCLCGKDFVDIPFLQAHWRATHMNGEDCHTNNRIYVGNYKENVSYKEKLCETCGCYMPQFSALEKHIILTHTVVRPPYECKCDDVFPSEAELKRHILTCSW